MNNPIVRSLVAAALVLGYFVLFPEDLAALLTPLQQLLGLSGAVSPWLYALLGVALICWTLERVWGNKPGTLELPQRSGNDPPTAGAT